MAHVAIFRAGQPPQYLRSVHTPDYLSDPDAVINPDVTALAAVPLKYWKRVGATVVEMTAGEKTTVDSAAASAMLATQRVSADLAADAIQWRAFAGILLDEINILRALSALPARTVAQARAAYANRISSGGADT